MDSARSERIDKMKAIVSGLEKLLFGHRRLILLIFLVVTLFMAYSATHLRINAGFSKMLPLKHQYMQAFIKHGKEFGGANRVLIALEARKGDIFTPDFMETLRAVTDEVFFVPGVDRSKVSSLFTPNVRFTQVTEEGFEGGNVIPSDFQGTPEDLIQVRKNILKSNVLGRLVSSDFTSAIISTELLEVNPDTGKRINYLDIANRLEKIRTNYSNEQLDIHIIGFAKFIGDMTDGAKRVVIFFGVAFFITTLLVYWYSQSFRLTIIPIVCSLIAVVWQLGLLPLLGFGIDPMSILVPFLVFAIGVSHGVQMIGATRSEVFLGANGIDAARGSFRRLLIPELLLWLVTLSVLLPS